MDVLAGIEGIGMNTINVSRATVENKSYKWGTSSLRALRGEDQESLTVLDADLGHSVGHVLVVYQLRLGQAVTLVQAKDMTDMTVLDSQFAGLAIEESRVVKGMGKETLHHIGTVQSTKSCAR